MRAIRAAKLGICAVVLVVVSRSPAFRSVAPYEIHGVITVAGIFQDFQDPRTLRRVLEANDDTDWDESKLNNHALHFDSEAFPQATQRLAKNLNDAIFLLSECEKDAAMTRIGEALHALQDFYSHSNWVEMNVIGRPGVTPDTIPIYGAPLSFPPPPNYGPLVVLGNGRKCAEMWDSHQLFRENHGNSLKQASAQ